MAETAPIPTEQTEEFTFVDIIPKLGPSYKTDAYPSLLPHLGGQPGYEYYQCPLSRQRAAQAEGWRPVQNTNLYTIRGPLGQLDLVLLCRGSQIPGTDTKNNRRVMLLDPDIEEITGLSSSDGMPKEGPTPVKAVKTAPSKEPTDAQ